MTFSLILKRNQALIQPMYLMSSLLAHPFPPPPRNRYERKVGESRKDFSTQETPIAVEDDSIALHSASVRAFKLGKKETETTHAQ